MLAPSRPPARGHQETQDTLRDAAVVERLLRGQLSVISPVTGEVIKFDGINLKSGELKGAAGTGPTADVATIKAQGDALSLALGVDIATYINDVFVYVDRIENHGVPLTTNAAESVYTALPDGTIVTAAPPQPPASLR